MRKNVFIKKRYDEEEVTIFIHFKGKYAIRQIERYSNKTIKLSLQHPFSDDCYLYDQKISDIEWSDMDFISEEEFEEMWNK